MLYIERIADICDKLNEEIDPNGESIEVIVPINVRNGRVSSRRSDVESRASSRSDNLTLLNTKKNELISLKRKTLALMNQFMSKTNKAYKDSGDSIRGRYAKDSPSVRFQNEYSESNLPDFGN